MSGKPLQRSPHFNGSLSPLKYLLACFVVHQILLTLFNHELLKIFCVVILKVISICLLLPFFFPWKYIPEDSYNRKYFYYLY